MTTSTRRKLARSFDQIHCVHLLLFFAPALTGCGRSLEHDSRFVGKWRSGLPVTGGVTLESPRGEAINAAVHESMRQDNASGAQGVDLQLRADGTFHLKMWTPPMDAFEDLTGESSPGLNISVEGTWHSEDETIFLTSSDFLPFAYIKKTRRMNGPGRNRYRSQQELALTLRSNGELSQFGDGVRPQAYETALNFRRMIEPQP